MWKRVKLSRIRILLAVSLLALLTSSLLVFADSHSKSLLNTISIATEGIFDPFNPYFAENISMAVEGVNDPFNPYPYQYLSMSVDGVNDPYNPYAGQTVNLGAEGINDPHNPYLRESISLATNVGEYFNLTMAVNGYGTTSPSVGVHSYFSDELITLTAYPLNTSCYFIHWLINGTATSTQNPRAIYLTGNTLYTAYFGMYAPTTTFTSLLTVALPIAGGIVLISIIVLLIYTKRRKEEER